MQSKIKKKKLSFTIGAKVIARIHIMKIDSKQWTAWTPSRMSAILSCQTVPLHVNQLAATRLALPATAQSDIAAG